MAKIKDIYKEVEEDKSNAPKGREEVKMDKEEYCQEHKDLIRILRTGTREELLAEADRQEEELAEYEDGEDDE